ncbi:CBS domain-containing protein [Rhodocytophaga aerolata]|uniref:CBS domain-containing protein n=1 Tax=Rhodocytophaga aerolata TaxID=455078 RepID=A0ABT8R9N3_9BACT|nr:CBS domain-containing protein [Rhodocytophaga aerolata]MDO1448805.1 CBS domain-containing protein [Rhodocytophaga aerolata]
MIAEELINQMIPPLKVTDTAEKALRWMEELRVPQLPVLEGQEYVGLISEEIIFQINDLSYYLSEMPLTAQDVYALNYQHFYDVLKLALDHHIQVVAVLNDDKEFMGVITVHSTIIAFAQSAVQEPGGIIVLSLYERDYSLSEISRLVESNDSKILSSYVCPDRSDPLKIKLTIKLNRKDISRVVATFERFDYRIIAKFQNAPDSGEDKERLDLLLKYLNM